MCVIHPVPRFLLEITLPPPMTQSGWKWSQRKLPTRPTSKQSELPVPAVYFAADSRKKKSSVWETHLHVITWRLLHGPNQRRFLRSASIYLFIFPPLRPDMKDSQQLNSSWLPIKYFKCSFFLVYRCRILKEAGKLDTQKNCKKLALVFLLLGNGANLQNVRWTRLCRNSDAVDIQLTWATGCYRFKLIIFYILLLLLLFTSDSSAGHKAPSCDITAV